MSEFKVGQKISWSDASVAGRSIYEITSLDYLGRAGLRFIGGSGSLWAKGQHIGEQWVLDPGRVFVIVDEPREPKKQRRTARKNGRNELYLAASKEGMTFKGIANKVNERKVDTFGLSATQALSRYEDKFGKKLDINEAVVFKLVPFSVRIDKKNGRVRLGRQIRGA